MKRFLPAYAVTNERGYTVANGGPLIPFISATAPATADRDWVWKEAPSKSEWSVKTCKLGDLLSDTSLPQMQFLAQQLFDLGIPLFTMVEARWAKGGWHDIGVGRFTYREHGKKIYRRTIS